MSNENENGLDGLAEGPDGDQPMSFFDHLAELRSRLVRAALGITVGFAVCWFFRNELEALVTAPLNDAWITLGLEGKPDLVVLAVLDRFMTHVRIALTAGIFLAAPVLFWQLWMFVSPGLYAREKRYVIPFVVVSAVMFAAGAVFCYIAVLPYATQWFLEYSTQPAAGSEVIVKPQFTLPEYAKYTTKLLIAFGLMFEFPLLVFFLSVAGAITHKTLLRYWKISVLLIFVAAAFLTPPDPITLTFLAVPMVGLYFASVGVAYVFSREHREAMAGLEAEMDESDEGDEGDEGDPVDEDDFEDDEDLDAPD